MAMRHGGDQTLSTLASPAQARHLGIGAGLVDEDQAGRVERRLSCPPYLPVLGDVRTFLLSRVRGFF